ncbi:MAG: hypothetical protein IPO56_08135 [Flavobacteriales bacterium]|nr:hypothetical protein [Flavobacteriales bacterium]
MDVYRNLKVGCTRKGYMFTTVRAKAPLIPEVIIDIKLGVPISAGRRWCWTTSAS